MLAPSNPRSTNFLRAALRMRSSTSPASSFGGRPKRTAGRFAEAFFATEVFFKLLVFIAIPGVPPARKPNQASQSTHVWPVVNRNETVSFLLTPALNYYR